MIFARGLLFISLNVLVGILLSLRFIVLPSLHLLPADEAAIFMGKLMIRVRKALLVVGVVCGMSGLREAIGGDWSIARLSLIALFLLVILLIGIPPDSAWYPKLLRRRSVLLDAGLATGILTVILLCLPT